MKLHVVVKMEVTKLRKVHFIKYLLKMTNNNLCQRDILTKVLIEVYVCGVNAL